MSRVGLVGCGKIADSHVEQIRASGRAELAAVCDREPLMAEQLGVRMGVEQRFTDVAEMLRSANLDVLHVATPPDSHLSIALLGLQAGCHLFMEKPFALSRQEARMIYAAAAAARRRVSVNYLYNYESVAQELERLVSDGCLGEIVHLETSYGYNLAGDYGMAVLADPAHWVHRLPGKLFHNVLDHVVSKLSPFIDDEPVVEVTAFRRRPPCGIRMLDEMHDELRFLLRSGPVTASGVISAHGRPVTHALKVIGTRDTAEVDYAARTLVLAARQSQPSAIGRLLPPWLQARQFARNGWRNMSQFRRYGFHYFQGMRELLQRFYDCVASDGPDPVPPAQVVRTCGVIDAIVAGLGRCR
jgi:predicted dehydrogenase